MNGYLVLALLFAASLPACGGPYFDLAVDDEPGSGGSVSSNDSGSGASPGSGGLNTQGGAQASGSGGSGRPAVQLTRGGFGETMDTFRNGERRDGSIEEGCRSPREAFFVYQPAECLAASACLEPCDARSGDHGTITYRQGGGAETSAAAVCRIASQGRGAPEGQGYLVFPCEEGETCPSGLVCVESDVGPACFVRDVPWVDECADRFCPNEGSSGLEARGEPCGADHFCCPGFACTSTETCEPD